MKETVLLYNFNDKDRLMKIRQALLPLGFRIRQVEKEDYMKPLGTLAGVKGMEELTAAACPSDEVLASEGFEDEMALLAGLTSPQVDAFIKSLRRKGIGRIDYKAVLTPVNKDWDSVHLYHEIKKEHEAMTVATSQSEPEEA
ncbi:DUF3783 domain-containing protein [[Clostridium] symbiosum]|uniref:DUF3783 domain-containing protein n=1 Tax=Clostridium symbiosum TaxID=1512 RepID=UPI001D06763F|nr:DUF3783 domain-containing protein [[Clostridium] symbiosum]MCB6611045.1 DUF3783 domain-containing protein [[Clostridium] symbiosum]MCB6931887.1 DUF3783 domain-containing protein [[Clostridium] symbiosum]